MSRAGSRWRRGMVLGFGAFALVLLLGLPVGGVAARPPADRSYSLLGSSWTFGVFSTGVLQEPDFRIPYTSGNSSVVVRPVVRGDAAWFDPGFIVRDAQANPSENPCPGDGSAADRQCIDANRREQDSALATFRYPYLSRCLYPDPPNANVSYPLRIFEHRDFADNGFPKPPATQQSSGSVLGAVVYGEASCNEDYSVKLRAVNEDLLMGAEASPSFQASTLKSTTRLFFDGPDKTIGVVQSSSVAEGVNFMNGLLTIEALTVTGEARSNGERPAARVQSSMKIVGAKVNGVPVEIRRDGVQVATTNQSTEGQRKQLQDAVNGALAAQKIKIIALAVDERIENGGEDSTIRGGGIQIDMELPKATLPAPVLALLQSAGITPPQTTIDTLAIQIGHLNLIAHAVTTPPLPPLDILPLPPTTTEVFSDRISTALPTFASTYQVPAVERAISQPQPTNATPSSGQTRGLVKLPGWALLLLAFGAGTVISATYVLTQQRLPIDLDL